jgi:hypothetical protein
MVAKWRRNKRASSFIGSSLECIIHEHRRYSHTHASNRSMNPLPGSKPIVMCGSRPSPSASRKSADPTLQGDRSRSAAVNR